MNAQEQIAFVETLSDTVMAEIMEDIAAGKTPENWDGIELRKFLAYRFDQCVFGSPMTGKRLRQFKDTIFNNDL